MAASAGEPTLPDHEAIAAEEPSPAQKSSTPMMSLTMTTLSVPDHCASASARWRDRRRSIPMTEFRFKDAYETRPLCVIITPIEGANPSR